jgi:hypothetical protein
MVGGLGNHEFAFANPWMVKGFQLAGFYGYEGSPASPIPHIYPSSLSRDPHARSYSSFWGFIDSNSP